MACPDCDAKKIRNEKELIQQAAEKARKEAPGQHITGELVLIVERVNETGFFWIRTTDERAGRLRIVDRVYID